LGHFMALRNTRWLQSRPLAVALAMAAMAAVLPAPAQAQFFDDRYPFSQPSRRPAPPSSNFFSFPYYSHPPQSRPAPVDSSRAPSPHKQETPPTSTIVVIGDSFADWLSYGLEEVYADTPEIGVVRKIRANSGLVRYESRNDALDWSQAIKDILAPEKPRAIVVMLGLNDRLPLRERATATPAQEPKPAAPSDAAQSPGGQPPAARDTGPYDFRSDRWAELYGKRIDDMIVALKSRGVPVIWVGLPAIRGPKSTSDLSYLDELYRSHAERAGIVYVDIWDGFVDENGRYAVEGPDFEGQTRRLRSSDGVHFTKIGAVKLAHYVEHELTRILTNRVMPVALPGPEAMPKPGTARPAVGPILPLAATGAAEGGDLLGGGSRQLPAAADPAAARVLVHGDAVAAPAGRADDFRWPRPDVSVSSEAAPAAAPLPPAAPTPAAPPKKTSAAPNTAKKQ
jgi:uncharacterized protein